LKSDYLKRDALFAAALLAGSFMSAAGAVMSAKSDFSSPMIEKQPDENPLRFLDGKLLFDIEERFRWEIRDNNFDFNDSVKSLTDDNWFLSRFRLGATVIFTNWLKIYAQAQDSQEINSDRPDIPGQLAAEGDDTFDLRQAWVEFGNLDKSPLTLKLGRQTLTYGDERLIGAFDWNNIGRTFDAVKVRWEQTVWSLDTFASSVVVPKRGSFNQSDLFNGNETGRGQIFSGLYFSTTAVGPQVTDLYMLQLHENANPLSAQRPVGDTDFFTFGSRVKSKPGAFAFQSESGQSKDGKAMAPAALPKAIGFDYEGELAFQSGTVRGLNLTAFAAHAGLGYTFDIRALPRLGLAYNYGSGDGNPTDRNIGTFQNLFPTNHKYYGQMDVFSWQNMHDLELSVRAQPHKTVAMKVEGHAFWLATTDDVWYRANGVTAVRPLTPAARAASNYAGAEVDFLITWSVNQHLQFEGGYSRFFAGQYLDDTGSGDDANFGYLQAKLTF
jgi:hypothetical protein